ncbi:MAG TPA: penicillin-binding transpeptidase domain-containing protein [Candidatus Acidoferrales bacterium]|nr:penicillin-binding transpeptidase domain-containing protein [Candidatus Acidoferrales bacterium]
MEQRNPRLRWLIVWVVAVVWLAVVLARLSYLQLFCYSDYFAKAQHQQERIFEISPNRSTIYDRKGRELAVSLPMDSVFADPADITDPGMVARLLSHVLDIPAEDLENKIREAHSPVRLARKLSPETVQRIDGMNLRGVFFQKENRRMYPQRELAASVLGYVDVDEKGIGGIEYSLDKDIRGRPGRMMVLADGRRHWYDRHESAADPGDSVVLTIDETIQYIAEKELAAAIAKTHAKGGVVLVQDPNSGELLAVASWPTFDPNDAGKYPPDDRMDRAVTMAYEPGSVFKVITMTGAIENGVATPDDLIDCQMGSIVLAGRVIHDHKAYGTLSVRQILEDSSDVGAIKVALRLGAPRFYDTIRQFGFGQLTGISLPGENHGLLRPLDDWSGNSIGSIAMGQEVSATPIQIISAISAIANGGILYEPRIVREIAGGTALLPQPRPEQRRVTDARTAATLRGMMEDVILEGTGKNYAQLDGYTAGGKTGTAQKIDPATGRYSRTNYMASFAGFAPVNDPAVTILAVLDSPVGGHEGNETAGPVFKRVAEQVLAYLDVPHDVPPPSSDVETARNSTRHPLQSSQAATTDKASEAKFDAAVAANKRKPAAPTVAFGDDSAVVVPNLAGETVRAVSESCTRLGLVPTLIGNGVALEQSPSPGAQVLRGAHVTIRFGRAGSVRPVSEKGSGN